MGAKAAKPKRTRGKQNLLTVAFCKSPHLKVGKKYADGDRLYIDVRSVGTREWLFRFTSPSGRKRDMVLGAFPSIDLAEARRLANECRAAVARGDDPIDLRNAKRAAAKAAERARDADTQQEQLTLARFAREYHAAIEGTFKNTKHAAQWIQSLETHVPAAIWHKPIAQIKAGELLDPLLELQKRLPETGRRVRQRLESVFAVAVVKEKCASNPAADIRKLLGGKRSKTHYAALPWDEVPEFVARLREISATAARAFELALLTASRTSEVLLASFDEFDLRAARWIIPKQRMKGDAAHTVYLSARAVEIIREQKASAGKRRVVFESPMLEGKPLSNMAFLMLLRRLELHERTTPHGVCRASFSTWANEHDLRPDVIEASLAHREQNLTRAAYNRAQFVDQRRALMAAWGEFAASECEQQ
jgi:integrase